MAMAEMGIVESSLVAPVEETPKHSIWLSNIDLILMFYIPTVYFYRRPNGGSSDFFSVEALKASLARALVAFYPMAGRLGRDRDGRPEINCTGEGALFTVARSEGCMDDFGDFLPSPEMRRLLVPSAEASEKSTILLMIQVTFFKCGGVAIGLDMQHAVVDGRSAFNFIQHWCNLTRGISELAIPPFFDRTVLRSRSPPNLCHQSEKFVCNPNYSTSASAAVSVDTTEPCVSSVMLELSESQVNALKKTSEQQSTFQAIMGHVWRCASIARQLAPDKVTKFIFIGEIRSRLKPALPPGYFGNAVCRAEAVSTVGEIVSNPVIFAARKIGGTIAGLTDEYARSVIDHIEAERKEGRFDQCARSWLGMSEANVSGNSWLGLAMEKADFGWGKPEHMGRARMISGSGKVYILPGRGGGVSVLMSLETKNMERFKELFYKDLRADARVDEY